MTQTVRGEILTDGQEGGGGFISDEGRNVAFGRSTVRTQAIHFHSHTVVTMKLPYSLVDN